MGILQSLKQLLVPKAWSEDEMYQHLKSLIWSGGHVGYFGELLAITAQKFPDAIALITPTRSITYKELFFRSALLSHELQKRGVQAHESVLLLFENSIDFYVAYFAIFNIGAICVPLNVFLHERELLYIIKDATPKAIIYSKKFIEKIGNVKKLFGEEAFPLCLNEDNFNWIAPLPRVTNFAEKEFKRYSLGVDELCLLLYTSGTTGTPKGVMLSSQNILTNALQCAVRLSSTIHSKKKALLHEELAKERFFAALPLFHVFAQNTCIWFPLLVGGSVIVVSRIDRREILEALQFKPTLFFGVPALYGLLSLLKNAPLNSIKYFVSGGDALPDKIRAAFAMVYGRKICAGYGLTEASPVVAVNVEQDENSTNVVGTPLVGVEIDVRNDQGASSNSLEVGTLWVKGKNVMLGYYNAPEETQRVIKDGWLNTGDLATFDHTSGKLAIVGRTKDLIIHKGFNIYPQEVENVLLSHPAVFQAAVIGRDDAATGQVPIAFVAFKENSPHGDIDSMLRSYCNNYLATYKVPRKFICLDDLPLNQTGKVDKKLLQAD